MFADLLHQIHRACLEKNLVFVIFRMPRDRSYTCYIQTASQAKEWDSLNEIPEKTGFLMAPFDPVNGKKYLLLHPDLIFNGQTDPLKFLKKLHDLPPGSPAQWEGGLPGAISKKKYIQQIRQIKKSISRGIFQKAVLSRVKIVRKNYIQNASQIFQALCETHPDAFVFLFKSGANFWTGASPEPLIRLASGKISTVSLAGTRPISDVNRNVNNWTPKEALEQEHVTRYIHDVLRSFRIRDYGVTSPYVKQAGDLLHLRTDFNFQYDSKMLNLWDFVESLHPTPAVAGQPKEEAISFIRELEEHHREYYTGYLGPVGPGSNVDLFVNLRCMKITPGFLSLYVGGGITLESIPEDEWKETDLKAASLLHIIQSCNTSSR